MAGLRVAASFELAREAILSPNTTSHIIIDSDQNRVTIEREILPQAPITEP